MVDFRKRFGEAGIGQMAEAIAIASLQPTDANVTECSHDAPSDNPPSDDANPSKATAQETSSEEVSKENENRGQLIADASCAPADIRYPTDVSLLNEARDKTDEIIDELHNPLIGKTPRPRTYRVKARHDNTYHPHDNSYHPRDNTYHPHDNTCHSHDN